jgi:hypothetical protein
MESPYDYRHYHRRLGSDHGFVFFGALLSGASTPQKIGAQISEKERRHPKS